ncbi:ankyrin repeat and sterile alpha motif domain-containing protein 1B-like isoform X2 [Contarinia nasturtii]|uniref:ankyrin repeat and sterile alpha motif domain-containing protein 1B-like isoform X2 n=1 Tax=Contarinia nasturtii TaxID=265458 RepID=UPI0012D46A55|nr:ankyrin repeat and sterile alpha motif domain-containing protein 1B-like isoform X2 [Contarinia nasturtii]
MGKDQELLEAARNGNITLIEKILNQRGKRSGPLASLRRGPGANIQDSAGYSALHYSALNGHAECVRLLLMHEASANLPDSRGSSPLHLAAWAGHQDIVKLLLTQANRPANPNLQTIDNETPLHCAAQHGHTGALTTLLAHGANPNMMNCRGEKPLDLAAQYGRLQVVQMLVRAHPELIHPYKKHYDKKRSIYTHTPLHLASRNGHKHVVEVLLAAGVDVNILTGAGTALHESALHGKDSVVKTLLEFGADLDVTDSEGRTALDLLKQFPPHVTRGIVAVINNYQNSLALSSSEQEDILKVSRNIPSRESYYDDQSYHSRGTRESHAWSSYSNDASSMLESPSSSVGSLDPASPRIRAGGDNNGGFYVTMTPLNSNSKVSPTPPKKPPRRNLSISPSTSKSLVSARSNMSGSSSQTSPYEYLYLAQSGDKKSSINKAASVDQCQNYVKMMSPAAKEKHEAVLKQMSEHLIKTGGNLEDGEPITAAPLRSYNPNRKLRRIRDNYDYSQNGSRNSYGNSNDTPMSPSNYRQPPTPDHPPPNPQTAEKVIFDRIRPLSQEYRRSMAMLEYIRNSQNGTATFGGYENRHRVNSEKREKRQSAPQPSKQSINHHQQQQKQHHHRHSYQENIVPPPPIQYSNRSRHRISNNRDSSLSPCSSDVIVSHSLNASSGSLSSVSSDRSASTDCVEYVTDVPFAAFLSTDS